MKTVVALLALCFTSLIAQGQEGCQEPKIVKTTGTAELKVTPDKAMLLLGVERQSATARNAKAEVASTSRKILAALKDLNIEEKDIQTAYLYLEPMIDYRKGLRITNFTAEQSLSVTVRDLSKLDAVMDAVITAGANRIGGIEYQSSELRKYKDQAREEAAHAAREKGEALAKALGNQIGKTHSVEELPQSEGYYGAVGGLMANTYKEESRSQAPSTAPGELTIKASVVVSFDLL
ncbi:MAG TPA: SIMPL domain-containing protein [Terriglobales bacterium]|nr:SIMPL domain-containing protein [Terriglobales bacterium]